jgi:hypothetical protein
VALLRKGLEKAVAGWSEKVKARLAEEVAPRLGGETVKAVALANTPVKGKFETSIEVAIENAFALAARQEVAIVVTDRQYWICPRSSGRGKVTQVIPVSPETSSWSVTRKDRRLTIDYRGPHDASQRVEFVFELKTQADIDAVEPWVTVQ